MLRDRDSQINAVDNEKELEDIPKSMWIYSSACIIVTILIAVFMPQLYPGSRIWINTKKMLLLSILWPLAYIDYKTMRIPNIFIVYGLICRGLMLVVEFLLGNPYIWASLLSEIIAAFALLVSSILCSLCVKNGIGFGDMKLFIIIGLFLGLESIWSAVFLALIISFFVAIYLLLSKKKTRKDAIPFGPAIVLGTYLSICIVGM